MMLSLLVSIDAKISLYQAQDNRAAMQTQQSIFWFEPDLYKILVYLKNIFLFSK